MINLNNPQEFQKAIEELTPDIALKAIDTILMVQQFTRPEHIYFSKCLELLRPIAQAKPDEPTAE
jgi:hypothetical protein